MDFSEIAIQVEEHLRLGRRDAAQSLLAKLKGKKIIRRRAPELATLARRAGLLNLALQIMSPIMRPKVPLDQAPTDSEISTYSLVLLGLGAIPEALELLSSGKTSDPEINLALAFSHMKLWDYPAAIGFLNTFLAGDRPAYEMMIAKVNLAAAYVATDSYDLGKNLLEEILEETHRSGWSLLHKNALELSAQLAIFRRDWAPALEFLSRASGDPKSSDHPEDVWVSKWRAILYLSRDGATKETLDRLREVRCLALETNHWETVRHCDHHLALATQDAELCRRVYFGTPFESFRRRLERETKNWLVLPGQYEWQMQQEKSSRVFDLAHAEEPGGEVKVKPGKGLHAALVTLTSDFYRPFVIGSLHSAVFPGEFFNPVSSPRRVAFLIHRLREWLEDNDVPLTIQVDSSGYRLEAHGPYGFLIGGQAGLSDSDEPAHFQVMLEKLKSTWPVENFSASEAAQLLEVSIRTARYLLAWALDSNRVEKHGVGRSTKYRLTI